jgi:hypothetical protein
MPIPLQCPCGRDLRVKDDLAGRKIKCPDCSATLIVPTIDPDEGLVSEKPFETSSRKPASHTSADDEGFQASPKPSRRNEETDPDEADVPQRRRRDFDEDDDDDYDDRGRRRRDPQRAERRARLREIEERADRRTISRGDSGGGWFGGGGINAGIGGGVVMMVIAIVWFVVGQAIGITFIYPVVMFIIGLIAVVRGLVRRD